jgi:hypothetical protein
MTNEQILIAAIAVLAVILLSWLWRWYRGRRVEKAIDRMPIEMVESPTEKDLEAYRLVRRLRQEIWQHFGDDMSLNPQGLYTMSFDVIREVAAVYYPGEPEPQYKANIDGLLDLNSRILQRLNDILDKPVIGKLRGLDVSTILSLKKGYDKVRRHPVTEFIMSKPALRKLWQAGWSAANIFNPWYWGRKVFLEVGLETGKRYLVTALVTIVGEEAVMLYSGRRVRNAKAAAEMMTIYEMIRTLRAQDSVSVEEYEVLIRWLVKFKHLDSVSKVKLLQLLQDSRKMPEQDLMELVKFKGQKRFLDAFGELAEARGPKEKAKRRRLDEIKALILEQAASGDGRRAAPPVKP